MLKSIVNYVLNWVPTGILLAYTYWAWTWPFSGGEVAAGPLGGAVVFLGLLTAALSIPAVCLSLVGKALD